MSYEWNGFSGPFLIVTEQGEQEAGQVKVPLRLDLGTVTLSLDLTHSVRVWTADVGLWILSVGVWFCIAAPRVTQLEGNSCEIFWETVPPMRGDPVSYVLQVLVGRDSEYKQVRTSVCP